jgi:hypothetical protein
LDGGGETEAGDQEQSDRRQETASGGSEGVVLLEDILK